MNWISNYVRPKINSLFSRREIPENLWVKCDECGTMLFHRELVASLQVCTNCGHHMPITPRDRFTALFDGGVFVEVSVPRPVADPLGFRDQKKYVDRLREARKATGEEEAMLVAEGEIARLQVVAAAQDFSFMAGSMGDRCNRPPDSRRRASESIHPPVGPDSVLPRRFQRRPPPCRATRMFVPANPPPVPRTRPAQ
jgi:acetyl-CoA carboxylase beta subunit